MPKRKAGEAESFHDLSFKAFGKDEDHPMSQYKDQVVLVVNVASF
jgi:glutathione peroxidase-family protein